MDSVPAPFLTKLPAAVPSLLMTPPPSITPPTYVLPAPSMVSVLMIVCTSPLMVNVLPAAVVQVCGAPTVTGALMVNELLAVMPPAVTVSEPPESE